MNAPTEGYPRKWEISRGLISPLQVKPESIELESWDADVARISASKSATNGEANGEFKPRKLKSVA